MQQLPRSFGVLLEVVVEVEGGLWGLWGLVEELEEKRLAWVDEPLEEVEGLQTG